ncbi:MAG: DNA cytosine methyltransferase [Gomphosphaeria aponina SAG 52.96 = DSM 107014]|uniref:Cytosine-specific methyltransferase n=1 Tax=Gomphosphaeria aponina SAG 52.96 = DSM 107014 TaxID=1521640 RepID=A0A941JMQ0_9CHRO|nr:DNA cytosine methyltransferase [Gomphosphaeria aponina SAG 52.96 = DSM 107014]
MRVIDLFAGCGGLSLGFENAGYTILAAYDNWDVAVNIYRQNFNHPIYQYDLSQYQQYLEHFKNLNPDLIMGGPPCQDFSSAGKRNENLGRGDLTLSFVEIITHILPKFFVMENVERFNKTQRYREAKSLLKKANYGITEKIIDASLCNVPQKRKRFFWLGIYQGEDQALSDYLDKNLSNKPMTVREYLGNTLDINYYYRHPRSYQRRAIFSIDEPSPTIRGVNRPLPKNYKLHPGDAAPLTENVRPLTTIERSYLQTFPKTFIFEGSKTDVEQIIGNAVPVQLAEYVANCILEYLDRFTETKKFKQNSSFQRKNTPKQLTLPI